MGHRNVSKSTAVKAWIIDPDWGQKFTSLTRSISSSRGYKESEKPVSWKQLEEKYTEDELAELWETGGIIACPHSRSSKLTMYIDKGDWERWNMVTREKQFKTQRQQKMEDDSLEDFETLDEAVGKMDVTQTFGVEHLFTALNLEGGGATWTRTQAFRSKRQKAKGKGKAKDKLQTELRAFHQKTLWTWSLRRTCSNSAKRPMQS